MTSTIDNAEEENQKADKAKVLDAEDDDSIFLCRS